MSLKTVTVVISSEALGSSYLQGSRAQSGHFPDPLFQPCGADEKTKRQWGRQFWNHCYNERKTTAHQPGCRWKHITQWKRAHARSQAPHFLPLSSLATEKRFTMCWCQVSSSPSPSLSCSLTKRKMKGKGKHSCDLWFLQDTWESHSVFPAGWLVVCGPQCLLTSSLISSLIGWYGFGHPCHIPLALH